METHQVRECRGHSNQPPAKRDLKGGGGVSSGTVQCRQHRGRGGQDHPFDGTKVQCLDVTVRGRLAEVRVWGSAVGGRQSNALEEIKGAS